MDELYEAMEQLRDIVNGQETYDNKQEYIDNVVAQFHIVDEVFQGVYASAVDTDLIDEECE